MAPTQDLHSVAAPVIILGCLTKYMESGDLQSFSDAITTVEDKTSFGKLFTNACRDGKDNFVKLMLDIGVNVDIREPNTGTTGLMFAANYERKSTVILLLGAGADIWVNNYNGITARQLCNTKQMSKIFDDAGTADSGLHSVTNVTGVAESSGSSSTEGHTKVSEDAMLINLADKDDESKLLLLEAFVKMNDLSNTKLLLQSINDQRILCRGLAKFGKDCGSKIMQIFVDCCVDKDDAYKLQLLRILRSRADLHNFRIVMMTVTVKSILCDVFTRACNRGKNDFVKLMLDFGVDVNVRDISNESTGLMWAAQGGYDSTVTLLLDAGADALLRNTKIGYTARDFTKSKSIHKILDDAQATTKLSDERCGRCEKVDTCVLTNIGDCDDASKSLLLESVLAMGDVQNFKLIFNSISDKTKLGGIFKGAYHLENSEFMKIVVDFGINQDDTYKLFLLEKLLSIIDLSNFKIVLWTVSDKSNLDELFITACACGQTSFVTLMLDFGVDVNIRDTEYGSTGLMFAAQNNRDWTVRILLGRGADMSLRNLKGFRRRTARQFTNSEIIHKILDDFVKTRNELPQEATVSVPQEATMSVPQEATMSVPQEATMSVPQEATMSVPQEATDGHVKESQDCATQEEAKLPDVKESEVCASQDQRNLIEQIVLKTTSNGDEILIVNNSSSGSKVYFKKFGTTEFIAL